MTKQNPLESRLGLTLQVVRRTNPHVDRTGVPATKMMTTMLDVRDDLSFPFIGKRRARSKKKESNFNSQSLQIDEIKAGNIVNSEMPSPKQLETADVSISDKNVTQ